MQEIREKDEVVIPAPIDLEGAAGNRPVTFRHAEFPRMMLGEFQNRTPIDRDDSADGTVLAISMPNRPWPAAMSSTFFGGLAQLATSAATPAILTAMNAPMPRANFTQTGLSAEIFANPTDPPLRT